MRLSKRVTWSSSVTVWVLLLVSQIASSAPNFVSRTWLPEDGLPQNKVMAVTQTHDGYIWVGTYNGIARFDGVRFKNFDSANTPALADSRVTSLFEDKNGFFRKV